MLLIATNEYIDLENNVNLDVHDYLVAYERLLFLCLIIVDVYSNETAVESPQCANRSLIARIQFEVGILQRHTVQQIHVG